MYSPRRATVGRTYSEVRYSWSFSAVEHVFERVNTDGQEYDAIIRIQIYVCRKSSTDPAPPPHHHGHHGNGAAGRGRPLLME